MVRANMLDQAFHRATNRIYISVLVADGARVLAIGRVTLEHEALSEPEFARFHNLGLVAFFEDCAWCALAYHPEVVGCNVEAHSACGALAWTTWREGSCQWLILDVLEIEAIAAEELIWRVVRGRCSFGRRNRALRRCGAYRVAGRHTLLCLLEGIKGAFARGVGSGDELGLVGACELAVVLERFLQNVDDGLLEGDDLGLELVFGDGCL
jgi:hypothetical protein